MESRQRMKEKRKRFFENGGKVWNKNRPRTELEKQHISEAVKKAMARPEVKEKMDKVKNFKSHQSHHKSQSRQSRQTISEAVKKAMARPEVKEKMMEGRRHKSFGKVSSLEKIFRDEFKKRGINFEWNYETTFGIKETSYFNRIYFHKADFYLPDKNLIIEINGCYWHGCPIHYPNPSERQKERIIRDNDLKQYVLGKGFNMLVIWEHEMKDKIHQVQCSQDKIDNIFKRYF